MPCERSGLLDLLRQNRSPHKLNCGKTAYPDKIGFGDPADCNAEIIPRLFLPGWILHGSFCLPQSFPLL